MNILEELYYGNINISERDVNVRNIPIQKVFPAPLMDNCAAFCYDKYLR